jgi:dTDP-4-amino-4,6-dideoxygalactose transaminase
MKVPLLDLKEQNDALRPEIEAALGRVLDTNGFILGGEVAELEKELAAYCGTKYAIGCASGSDALLLAMIAFDVGPGEEVITTPYSFFATVSAITRLGAIPVFVDIDRQTYNLDVSQIESKITGRTKAIEPVHLYGQCADMTALREIAAKHKIPLVEDAAQAIGADENGMRAGAMSEIGCFSFYPSKNLGGMGDGGFMTTDDDAIAGEAARTSGPRFEGTLLPQMGRFELTARRLSGRGASRKASAPRRLVRQEKGKRRSLSDAVYRCRTYRTDHPAL